jgi:hypothetical protein
LFAAALFLAAAFFVTYSEPNESDADGGSTGNLTISNVHYQTSGTEASAVGWISSISANLEIPATVSDGGTVYSVTSIGKYAFNACSELTSVVLPSSVTAINDYAFRSCSNLVSVVIPSGVTSVGIGAFEYCVKLTSVVIPSGVTSIGYSAFQYCSALTSVVIPSGVTSIVASAFLGCTALTSVEIPESVTSIGYSAFQYCSALTSIVIPSGVTVIEYRTFFGCSNLTSVTVPDSVTANNESFYNTKVTTVTVTGSYTGTGGIIDTYFRAGAADNRNWRLPGIAAADTAKCLILPDISSSCAGCTPDDMAAASGRELHYSDAEYIWDSASAWDLVSCSVFGTLTSPDGRPVSSASVKFESDSGITYSAVTASDGGYSIGDLPAGTSGIITASKTGYHKTGVSSVSLLPLTASVSGADLTLDINTYSVAFSSGSYYTVYEANGSPISSPLTVTEGESLAFRVQASEGYSVSPYAVSGNTEIILQTDGLYRIPDIRSDLNVTVTVSAGSGDISGGVSGSGTRNGSGNSGVSVSDLANRSISGGDSADGVSYWVPVLAVGAFLACIAAAAIGHTVLMRGKN